MSDMTTYETWAVIGQWFSGLATVGAAITALYIALRSEKSQLEVFCGMRLLVGDGSHEDIVWINATNKKPRMAIVTAVYFRWRQHYVFWPRGDHNYIVALLTPGSTAGRIPAKLQDGEGVDLTLSTEWLANLAKSIADKTTPAQLNLALKTLRVCVSTSRGEKFYYSPEKSFLDALRKHWLPSNEGAE